MPQIFISYRRADTNDMSRRLYDALVKRIGVKRVFRDADTLMKGHDFRAGIERFIFESDIMRVLIGKHWLNIRDKETGERRLDNPEDYVRIEVAMGLRHVKTVIPVLIDGAPMPDEEQLPRRLSPLTFKNTVKLHSDTFNADFEVLMRAIAGRRLPWGTILAGIAILVAVVISAMLIFQSDGNTPTTDVNSTPTTAVTQNFTDTPTPTNSEHETQTATAQQATETAIALTERFFASVTSEYTQTETTTRDTPTLTTAPTDDSLLLTEPAVRIVQDTYVFADSSITAPIIGIAPADSWYIIHIVFDGLGWYLIS